MIWKWRNWWMEVYYEFVGGNERIEGNGKNWWWIERSWVNERIDSKWDWNSVIGWRELNVFGLNWFVMKWKWKNVSIMSL